jgi:hypothetical protein
MLSLALNFSKEVWKPWTWSASMSSSSPLSAKSVSSSSAPLLADQSGWFKRNFRVLSLELCGLRLGYLGLPFDFFVELYFLLSALDKTS